MKVKVCDRCRIIMDYKPQEENGGGFTLVAEGEGIFGRERIDLCPECREKFYKDFLEGAKNSDIPSVRYSDFAKWKRNSK